MASSPAIIQANEEYHNRTSILLFHVDSILTSSSLIITVRTYLIQQINIKQKRLNMMTPTSPGSPKSPCSPRTPTSIISHISPVEQYMSGWMPSTPVLEPAVTHIQISTNHCGTISTQFSLGSPLTDARLRDTILSPRAYQNIDRVKNSDISNSTPTLPLEYKSSIDSSNHIFNPTCRRFPRDLREEKVISPVAERTFYITHESPLSRKLQRLASPPLRRRKRTLNSIEQDTPALPPNSHQIIAEFDQCRPRRTRKSKSNPLCTTTTTTTSPPKVKLQLTKPHPLLASISHLSTPLIPLISVVSGLPHPEFPTSLLQYHLLTHSQLDSLARWYHQTTDSGPERAMYPAMIRKAWTTTCPEEDDGEDQIELEAKRRRFGRFIGLRGCESPAVEKFGLEVQMEMTSEEGGDVEMRDVDSDVGAVGKRKGEGKKESLEEKMEKEWRLALARAEEERIMMEKSWRGRF